MLVPPGFSARLSAEARAELERLQAGLAAVVKDDTGPTQAIDPVQAAADIAAWYLRMDTSAGSSEMAEVSIDVDLCAHHIAEAAEHGLRPTAKGIAKVREQWLSSARWPCFPGQSEPPLLRGG
ncbi:MAG: hypothetical protein AAF799_33610 [Myxococcota bacterium]